MIRTQVFATLRWAGAVIFVALLAQGCQDDGRFACGSGTCDLGTEVCIIGGPDECATCAPRPAACDREATCECVPQADDPSWGAFQCDDPGTCDASEGGLVLTCAMPHWGCG